jgi:uncharacterized phage protein gp47/JayE
MPGLSANGLEIRTQPELQALIEQALAAALPGVNVHAGPLQQLVGIVSEELAIAWEALQAIHGATDPATASALALDRVAALTGTLRRRPTRSRVVAAVNLNPGTTLPAGSLAAVAGVPDAQFRTRVAVTNAAPIPGNRDVELEALDTGPIAAPAGTLTVIVAPVAGWNSITNALDAELGTNIEGDDALRRRREAELTALGGGTVDAIRADLLRVPEVRAARVFENTTDVVNADGLPPHSFEAVVLAGDDDAIARQLWTSKPAGIETYGSVRVSVEDSAGEPHTIRFSRPIARPIRFFVNVRVDPSLFPADGIAQIQRNIVELGDREHGVGDDVVRSRFYCTAFAVAGVLDVPALLIGFDGGTIANLNLPIGARELATFDTSRTVVIVLPS